jgi:hypothetical protein
MNRWLRETEEKQEEELCKQSRYQALDLNPELNGI